MLHTFDPTVPYRFRLDRVSHLHAPLLRWSLEPPVKTPVSESASRKSRDKSRDETENVRSIALSTWIIARAGDSTRLKRPGVRNTLKPVAVAARLNSLEKGNRGVTGMKTSNSNIAVGPPLFREGALLAPIADGGVK